MLRNQITISALTEAEYESTSSVFIASITDVFEKEGMGQFQEDIQSEIDYKQQKALASLDLGNSNTYLLIAKMNGRVIGTISYEPCGEAIQTCGEHQLDHLGELGSLYVAPSYQGQGVGSALIKEMMIFLKEQGIEQFCLDSGSYDYRKHEVGILIINFASSFPLSISD